MGGGVATDDEEGPQSHGGDLTVPLPAVLIGLGWIIGSAILGGAVGYGIGALVEFFVDGETDEADIAVLGLRGSGKTTLIRHMKDGIIRDSPDAEATLVPENYDGFLIQITDDTKLSIRSGRDVPGSPDYYCDWEEEFKSATHVLYLMNAHRASSETRYRKSVLRDIKKLRAWCRDEDRDSHGFVPEIWIVGTHCDLIERYSSENEGEFEDRVRSESGFEEIRMMMEEYIVRSVLGSLVDSDSADD